MPQVPQGTIEHNLFKDNARNRVHVVDGSHPRGKLARTTYRVLEQRAGTCLVELQPHTGRPHQLRVAMASLGTPILGDLRYGAREPLPDQSIALHAASLTVPHPTREPDLALRARTPQTAVWDWPTCRSWREEEPA